MLRIFLFLITNISVMFIFSTVLTLTGLQSRSIINLVIMSGLFGFCGSFFSLIFSKWIALRSVGGEIIKQTTNSDQFWLLKTVYNQSKKVGIKKPEIAIYDAIEINAFATGSSRNSSLIAVSTGLLQHMNKEESEAVIAHEISHIANGDMITMVLLQGIINTFVIFLSRIIAKIISNTFSVSKEDSNNNYNCTIYFISSMVLELTFGILATIITMWFSRYREFRADAGSAKLVGSNKMIAALRKLQISYKPEEVHHMAAFCIHGKKSDSILNLFLSHPPIEKRIEALYCNKYI